MDNNDMTTTIHNERLESIRCPMRLRQSERLRLADT